MEVGKLLYATDVKEPKFSEVECLMYLRSLGLREVIFLHATKMEGWEATLADYGIHLKTFVVKGPMAASILDAAHREAVSLIAVSLNRDMGSRFRRSLTRGLLRSSHVPVTILPERIEVSGSGQNGVFAHVIFGTDWSAASEKALSYLINLKTVVKTLEIVHVIERKLSVKDMRDLKEKLAQTRKTCLEQGIDAESHIYAGKPSEEIMLAAKDYDATCIVMGITRKSPMKALLSRSNSYRVAEASVVPMLVIP